MRVYVCRYIQTRSKIEKAEEEKQQQLEHSIFVCSYF